jgi:hypothetical protein
VYFDEAPKSRLEDLYDFEEQVRELRTSIRRRNRLIVLLGLRRTGKTSLLLSCLNAEKVPYSSWTEGSSPGARWSPARSSCASWRAP